MTFARPFGQWFLNDRPQRERSFNTGPGIGADGHQLTLDLAKRPTPAQRVRPVDPDLRIHVVGHMPVTRSIRPVAAQTTGVQGTADFDKAAGVVRRPRPIECLLVRPANSRTQPIVAACHSPKRTLRAGNLRTLDMWLRDVSGRPDRTEARGRLIHAASIESIPTDASMLAGRQPHTWVEEHHVRSRGSHGVLLLHLREADPCAAVGFVWR